MNRLAPLLRHASWSSFALIGFGVFFAVPWYRGFSHGQTLLIGIALCAALFFQLRRAPLPTLRWSERITLAHLIALGVAIRIVWLMMVPPLQLSDSKDYLDAAARLLDTGEYTYVLNGETLRAWRAPGYPFLLAASMAVVGENPWIPAFWNLIFFALAAAAIHRLGIMLAGKSAATAAVLLLALWPSLVMTTGLAQTETLSLLLLSAATLFWLKDEKEWQWVALAGVTSGLGAMVRPSLLLFPLVWIADALLRDRISLAPFKRVAIASICLMLVVLPWTLRNYAVIGVPIAVSSQGGDVFYRANNPIATGTWSDRGERDLTPFLHNEAQWNEVGYAWGKEWIAQHPVEFVKLAVKKLGFFFGADDTGAYWTVMRGHHDESSYRSLSALSDLWWLAAWALVITALWRARHLFSHTPEAAFVLISALYPVAIHAVYESQARYHLPITGLLCVIAGIAFAATKSDPRDATR